MHQRLAEFLKLRQAKYRLVTHPGGVTAQEQASSSHTSGWSWAKVVIVKERDGYMMAVLPACCVVDLNRLKGLIGHGDVQLATVEEIHGVEIVDPRPHAVGSIRALFERYPHLKNVVPAMGYTKEQVKELEDTINQSGADIVVAGTPIDLKRVIKVKMPVVRVRYDCPPELVERLRPLVARVFA